MFPPFPASVALVIIVPKDSQSEPDFWAMTSQHTSQGFRVWLMESVRIGWFWVKISFSAVR